MVSGVPRAVDIIRQLEREANAAAREHARDVADFHRRERLGRMETLIDDLQSWMEQRGDDAALANSGVAVERSRGSLRLRRGGRSLEIAARDDMQINVGGHIMRPDPDCPVLDRTFYDDVMARLIAWARAS